jgi:hypothetical protein
VDSGHSRFLSVFLLVTFRSCQHIGSKHHSTTKPWCIFPNDKNWRTAPTISRVPYSCTTVVLERPTPKVRHAHFSLDGMQRPNGGRYRHGISEEVGPRSSGGRLEYPGVKAVFFPSAASKDVSSCRTIVVLNTSTTPIRPQSLTGIFREPHWGLNPQQTCSTPKPQTPNGSQFGLHPSHSVTPPS